MADLSRLTGGPRNQGTEQPTAGHGKVTVAPNNLADDMRVVWLNFSTTHDYEVLAGHWMPRGADLPNKDDKCLIVFDDDGDAWVPAWSPS